MSNSILEEIITYVNKINEVDTTDVILDEECIDSMGNVFREDIITNGNVKENILSNAPEVREGCFVVPKTV